MIDLVSPIQRRSSGDSLGARLVHGVLAGAAGTTALNLTTYADMAIRGRPASSVPDDDVEQLAEHAPVSLGRNQAAQSRKNALGALLGYLTGIAGGVAWAAAEPLTRRVPWTAEAAVLGAVVMAATDASSAALGTTDPRRWSVVDWISDVIPHAAFGAATVSAYRATIRS